MTEKKLSHFDQNAWKYRPMSTVTASFDTTVRQMTEMFHQQLTEMSQRKKTARNLKMEKLYIFVRAMSAREPKRSTTKATKLWTKVFRRAWMAVQSDTLKSRTFLMSRSSKWFCTNWTLAVKSAWLYSYGMFQPSGPNLRLSWTVVYRNATVKSIGFHCGMLEMSRNSWRKMHLPGM